MNEKKMQVWVTKYWETKGIFTDEVTQHPGETYVYSTGRWRAQYRLGVNAFETELDAWNKVTQEARRKVESLRKKIARIERAWPSAKA